MLKIFLIELKKTFYEANLVLSTVQYHYFIPSHLNRKIIKLSKIQF